LANPPIAPRCRCGQGRAKFKICSAGWSRASRATLTITIYRNLAAGHSFFNKVRPTYDPAAALAATRIDALLASL
jgi:hypothetical protein